MTLYSFEEQLHKGEEYELILDELFSEKYDIEKVQLDAQRLGIDRIFTRKSSGVMASVEYKTDFIAQHTGNVFIETETMGGTGKQGWAFCSIAQLLVYFIPDSHIIYVADMLKIKLDIDKLAVRYDVKSVNNGHFKMLGVPVPFEVFEEYVISKIKWEG
jgi:hypothetical protein